MKLKLSLLYLIAFCSSSLFAQTQYAHDTTVVTDMDQATVNQQDTLARNLTPIKGKAIIYITRTTLMNLTAFAQVNCDGNSMGHTSGGKFLYIIVAPGSHEITSKIMGTTKFDLDVTGGNIYYIDQSVTMFGGTKLKLIDDEDQGKTKVHQCKLGGSNTYRLTSK
jgi:uncharacterized protein DUF2846